MSQIQIRDVYDNPLKDIYVRLALGKGKDNVDDAYDDKPSDDNGNLSFPTALPSPTGYTLQINNSNINKEYGEMFLDVDSVDAQDILIHLPRVPRQRAFISGLYSNVFLKGESAFLDLCRLCHGEDIQPLLNQSIKMGSNGRRNFFMTKNTAQAAGFPPFNPDDFSDYYNKVVELLELYADAGLYLYSSIFPDNQLFDSWRGNTTKQIRHWNRLGDIASQHTNWWGMELTNEPDAHPFNQVDTDKFTSIPGVICCSGSRGDTGGSPMPEPQWDVCDYHSPRHYPNEVVDMCVANHPSRIRGKAILLGEPLGFGPGRETNSRIAKEMSGSCRGTACGVIYHSTNGAFSREYGLNELNCGSAWFKELQNT